MAPVMTCNDFTAASVFYSCVGFILVTVQADVPLRNADLSFLPLISFKLSPPKIFYIYVFIF